MSECPHKELKKQGVGEFVYYACECGQKFRIEPWDGKVSVLAPPDPRKDLAALDELPAKWRKHALNSKYAPDTEDYIEYRDILSSCAAELEQRLAEMRGAKR